MEGGARDVGRAFLLEIGKGQKKKGIEVELTVLLIHNIEKIGGTRVMQKEASRSVSLPVSLKEGEGRDLLLRERGGEKRTRNRSVPNQSYREKCGETRTGA